MSILEAWKLLTHKHSWERYHPDGYQAHVRQDRCTYPGCKEIHHEGARGEYGQIIPFGFDAETERILYGRREPFPFDKE